MKLIADVGADQGESAVDGVNVAVDEAGEQGHAVQVGGFCVLGDGLLDVGVTADGDDFVASNGDGFGIGMFRFAGENLAVEENAIGCAGGATPCW